MSFSPMNVWAPDPRRERHRWRILLRLTVVATGLALIFMLVMLRSESKIKSTSDGKLRILRSFSVPLREISGLSRAGTTIFAVGDDQPLLGILHLADGKLTAVQTIDFTAPLWHNYFLCARVHNNICRSLAHAINKQWEGLHYDVSTNTVHLLQESTGSIFVFNRAMDRILARTMLDFFPDRHEKSARTDNSLGEGFLPLAKGHVLVAKEKFPAALIEFGNRNAKAHGYDPQQPAPSATVTASTRTLYPLHYWRLPLNDDKHCDLSDVTRSDDGELYGISQICQRIYRFAALDPRTEHLELLQSWHLGARIKAPEALVVIAPHTFLVASDIKQPRHNLWLLATADYAQGAAVAQEDTAPNSELAR